MQRLRVERLEERLVPSTSTIEFALPTSQSSPAYIAAGSDGNLWFTEFNGDKIGRITPSDTITEFPLPTAGADPAGIAAGPDGALWFTEFNGDKIGRITPSGTLTEFLIPVNSNPYGIAAGPDGNLWFTEFNGDKIGRITPNGTLTEFAVPLPNAEPVGIAVGPDGNLWFTEEAAGNIGRITPSGTFLATLTPPTPNSYPQGIAAGPDGALWFTEYGANKIGRVTSTGTFTEFALPTTAAFPMSIAAGPDGNLWFTELDGDKIGQITSSGTITEFAVPTPYAEPTGIAEGPRGLWFTEQSGGEIGQMDVATTDPPTGGGAPPLTADQQFVQTLYNQFLGRSGSLSELNDWVAQLPTLGQTGVASAVIHSPEAFKVLVDKYYSEYLGRGADQAGEAHWIGVLENGGTAEQVEVGMLDSPEYYSHASALIGSPNPDANFVQSLYQQLLGRLGTTVEMEGWVGKLTSLGRSGVANAILSSCEARSDLVLGLYVTLLHRKNSPTTAEIDSWVNSPFDLLSTEAQMTGSPEYFTNG
jgi:streptogramin lyase